MLRTYSIAEAILFYCYSRGSKSIPINDPTKNPATKLKTNIHIDKKEVCALADAPQTLSSA